MASDSEAGNGWVEERLARWRSSRDGEALGELVKWQRDRAYAVAWRILGNQADAEDAVQQAFAKLLTRTRGFAGADDLRVAVYRAVTQCALDAARANRARKKLEKAMSRMERNAAPQPHQAAERAEALRLVFEELEQLPEHDRALVVLCYQEGLSVTDAAQALALPRETLRDRLNGAMNDLRARLNRRGVALSLLLLAGLLQQGSGLAAPPSLCEALDETLPGAKCAQVPAAAAAKGAPEALIAASGSAMGISAAAKWGFAAAAAVMIGVVPLALWSGGSSRTAPVAAPPAVPAPVASAAAEPPAPAPLPALEEPAKPIAKPAPQAPDEILRAAARAVPGFEIKTVKQADEDGKLVYEFKGTARGRAYEVKLSAAGKVLELDANDEGVEEDKAGEPDAKNRPNRQPPSEF